jgi:hypothetical protein
MEGVVMSAQSPLLKARDVPIGLENGWRQSDEFVCRACGQYALLHPDTNWVWGCENCGFTTASPGVFFTPKEQ